MSFRNTSRILIIVCLCLQASTLVGQVSDTIRIDSTTVQNTPEDNGFGIFSMFDGNPGKAALFSLIIPGAGQAFNKRWWKVPLALAAEGTVIYILQNNISIYNELDADYKNVVMGYPSIARPGYSKDEIKRIRDKARQNKDYTWVAVIGVHIIVAADAFVDRHLIEFDVEDDLKVSFSPISPLPGFNLVVNF